MNCFDFFQRPNIPSAVGVGGGGGGGALPSKTPVSVLQELLSRRGTTPKYELVQIEGAIHEPTFRYRVTVGEVIGNLFNFLLI
jgi:hypothetical protein